MKHLKDIERLQADVQALKESVSALRDALSLDGTHLKNSIDFDIYTRALDELVDEVAQAEKFYQSFSHIKAETSALSRELKTISIMLAALATAISAAVYLTHTP